MQIIRGGINDPAPFRYLHEAVRTVLTANENGAGQKRDTPPQEWFADKDAEYLELHCIPTKKSLWKIENFDDFIAARKQLIAAKFSHLLLDESE